MKRYFLGAVVFICGAIVMAFEIVGSRMLGPYVGTSIIVWSAIIGIILFSLAAGYYLGGRIADRFPKYPILSLIIFTAAICMLFSGLLKNLLLDFLLDSIQNIKVISIIASLLLFSPTALFLGMVSPFAVRLKIKSLITSGATAGYLYAISTLGSILGTFLSGFFLIPFFTITSILLKLSILLLISAVTLFLVYHKIESNSNPTTHEN